MSQMKEAKRCMLYAITAMAFLAPGLPSAATEAPSSSLDALVKAQNVALQPDLASLDDLRPLAGTAAFPQGTALAAEWDRFLHDKGGSWAMVVDKRTGLPNLASGSGVPWVPGRGNSLSIEDVGLYLDGAAKIETPALERIAREFLATYPGLFPISPSDLALIPEGSGEFGGYLWFAQFQYLRNGHPVENARVVCIVNNGNLVQFGAENVAPIDVDTTPAFGGDTARALLGAYIGGFQADDVWAEPGVLSILPLPSDQGPGPYEGAIGQGMRYRLVYSLEFARPEVQGTWRAKLDAKTGEVLTFADINHYSEVSGGVFPAGAGSVEIVRPLPFVKVDNLENGSTTTTDRGGYYLYEGGVSSAGIGNDFVHIKDSCAAPLDMTTLEGTGDLVFGSLQNPLKCSNPGIGGNGNTRGSRTTYWYLNLAKQKALGWLPGNVWLKSGRLLAYVNYELQGCMSNGGGSSLMLCNQDSWYPDVIIHEFSHCLEDNDGMFVYDASTHEASAMIGSFIHRHESCHDGNYFLRPWTSCKWGDGLCLHCLGGWEADWDKLSTHTPNTPAGYMNSWCTKGYGNSTTCHREPHCEGRVIHEAVWDLAAKELPAMGIDQNTAWNIADRLWFLSRPSSGSAFTCITDSQDTITGSNGCGMGNWFNTFLSIDDDDGNLANGTPHGRAIFNAFNPHGMACATPPAINYNTCPSLVAPSVTAMTAPGRVTLTWDPVENASRYYVYRNEMGPNASYVLIAGNPPEGPDPPIITGTSYVDTEVANGVTYYYSIQARGSSARCFSPLASPATATPGGAFTITGRVTLGAGGPGLDGIPVTAQVLTNSFALTPSVVTNGGNYTFRVIENGAYKLIPWKVGYLFSPADLWVSVNGANVSVPDFSATKVSYVNGSITLARSGSPYGGVTVRARTYPGGQSVATTISDLQSGVYNLPLPDGTYTIAPESADHTFAPEAPVKSVAGADVPQLDFGATGRWQIHGRVTCHGKGFPGVGTYCAEGRFETDADGYYTAFVGNGSYALTPIRTGSTFSPATITIPVNGADWPDSVDFAADNGLFDVSGYVKINGSAVSGVRISSDGKATISQSDGSYDLQGLANGQHFVMATKDSFMFCPKFITIDCENQENQDFLAPLPGDCSNDCAISIGEVQGATNMYLGLAALGCGVDCNTNGVVSVGEVRNVINGFLGLPISCPRFLSPRVSSGPSLIIADALASQGGTVRIPVTLTRNGALIHSVGLNVSFDPALLTLDDVVSNGVHDWGIEVPVSVTSLGYSLLARGIGSNLLRFGLINTVSDPHLATTPALPEGVIAYLRFRVNSDAAGTAVLANECEATDADGNGFSSTCNSGSIAIASPCSLSCSASGSPLSGEAPLAVQFTATAAASNCTGAPSYFWSFGDGASSTAQNPSHTYERGGEYAWSFTATADGQPCWQGGTVSVTYPPGSYTISGKVTENGSGLPGVLMAIPGLSQTVTTRSDEPYVGEYAFTGLGNGTYRVTPSKTCKRFTPLYLDVTIAGSSQSNKNFSTARASLCTACNDALDRDMVLCGGLWDPDACTRQARERFSFCLHQATIQANSPLYNATLLAISVSRHSGQPGPESVPLTIAEEGDYFINVVNGDQVNRETMASSATVDLDPAGRIFHPDEIKWRDPFLVKPVHLTPGEYTLTVEVRSQPGAYISVVVSNLDFGTLPLQP